MNTFTLSNHEIFCSGYRLPLFKPKQMFPRIQTYGPYWMRERYEMAVSNSGKQTRTYKLLLERWNEVAEIKAIASDEIEQVLAVTHKKLSVKKSIVIDLARTHRLCQKDAHTIQVHYGTELKHTEGCLLVNGPSFARVYRLHPNVPLEARWQLESYLTQVRLITLFLMEVA